MIQDDYGLILLAHSLFIDSDLLHRVTRKAEGELPSPIESNGIGLVATVAGGIQIAFDNVKM